MTPSGRATVVLLAVVAGGVLSLTVLVDGASILDRDPVEVLAAEAAPPPTTPSTGEPPGDARPGTADRIRSLPPAAGIPPPDEVAAPVALAVPGLGVTAGVVVPVGVDADGALDVPAVSEIGWYRFGSAPGRPGSAVLAGHIAYDGVDGVFRHLAEVEPGATVEVTLDDGSTLGYEVTSVVRYDKDHLPADDLFAESGDDRLVLITCGGDFNPELRSYSANVVAIAMPLRS